MNQKAEQMMQEAENLLHDLCQDEKEENKAHNVQRAFTLVMETFKDFGIDPLGCIYLSTMLFNFLKEGGQVAFIQPKEQHD